MRVEVNSKENNLDLKVFRLLPLFLITGLACFIAFIYSLNGMQHERSMLYFTSINGVMGLSTAIQVSVAIWAIISFKNHNKITKFAIWFTFGLSVTAQLYAHIIYPLT